MAGASHADMTNERKNCENEIATELGNQTAKQMQIQLLEILQRSDFEKNKVII